MPLCYLYTNVPDKDLQDGMEERVAKGIVDILNKPLERVNVVVVPGARVFRQGSAEPACSITISSIGVFDKERNPGYTGLIKDLLIKEVNCITPQRISIIYHDLDKDMLG